jgi:hypothetical protein
MRIRQWLFGILVFLVSLAVMAPAELQGWLTTTLSKGRVLLGEPAGSFWSGRANTLDILIPGSAPIRLQEVKWRISPHHLLLGKPPVHLENKSGMVVLSGKVRSVTGGFGLSDFRASGRLETLAPYLKGGFAKGLAGEASLRSDDVSLGDEKLGKLDVEMRVSNGRLPAGTYSLALTGEGKRFLIRWAGPKGPKAMSGGGHWDNTLHLDGVPGSITR